MRLIDADKLVLHLNDYALQEAPFGRNDGKNQKEIRKESDSVIYHDFMKKGTM